MKPIVFDAPALLIAEDVLAPGLTIQQELEYETLSPFEVTNILIEKAEETRARLDAEGKEARLLNAGRGNPNFLNTVARKAFAKLAFIAADMADATAKEPALGFQPEEMGIADRLKRYLDHDLSEEAVFLKRAIAFSVERFHLDPDDFIYELVNATLGDFYPEPPRILPNIEQIVHAYLCEVLMANDSVEGRFNLFATEGATSAMNYVFKSLMENKILHYGDKVATITPIFAPYLEMPGLEDFQLVNIEIKENESEEWQITPSEIAKLENPEIKVLYLVNPTNPTAVGLCPESIELIVNLVKKKRPDLIVVDDTVYATFVEEFHSLVGKIPHNTICIYSYSKYFGVTGWRLGTVMLHETNIIDDKIAHLPRAEQESLARRYSIVSTTPDQIKFIDRIEMDSRDVALAHTGGLSGPQQCIMCIFSLFELMDEKKVYKQSIRDTLERRIRLLYSAFPDTFSYPKGGNKTHYYALINLEKLAEAQYGSAFASYLTHHFRALDFLLKLAMEKMLICLPGEGFSGPEWTLRVSLANLHDEVYPLIGQSIMETMASYEAHYRNQH